MSDDFDRLATAVRARRDQLGLSQSDVAGRGGPSTTTLSKIEAARIQPVPAQTRRKLERGLEWHAGSVLDVLAGGEPKPLSDTLSSDPSATVNQPREGSTLSPTAEALRRETVEQMTARLSREAEAAQVAFDQAVDQMLTAEAALDRANRAAFRALLVEERCEGGEQTLGAVRAIERSITEADVASMIVDYATIVDHEWTRYEAALVERFEPDYPRDSDGGLWAYSRYTDMTDARARVARITATWSADELKRPALSMIIDADRPDTLATDEPVVTDRSTAEARNFESFMASARETGSSHYWDLFLRALRDVDYSNVENPRRADDELYREADPLRQAFRDAEFDQSLDPDEILAEIQRFHSFVREDRPSVAEVRRHVRQFVRAFTGDVSPEFTPLDDLDIRPATDAAERRAD